MSRASVAMMVLSVAGLSAQVSGARAQQCSDDTGCPTGFECQVTGVSSTCSGSAPARGPSCPPDQPCDLPAQPLPPSTCTTQEYRSCVPRACTSDSECAAGMVCHTLNAGCPISTEDPAVCKDGICPPREPPPECKVRQQCVPRYLLPCEVASDCGEGFTCEAQKRCGCSASGTAPSAGDAPAPAQDGGQADREPPADAGAPTDFRAPAPPPDCTCEVTAEKYCKPVEVVCQADSDCPGDFTCQVTATSGSSGGAGGAFACNPVPGADGGVCGVALPAPAPPVVERRCVPPYDGVAVDLDGHGEPGRGETAAGGKGGTDQGTTNPVAPPNALPTGDSAKHHARACSALGPGTNGPSGGSLWASLLTLVAAMLVTRRRR